MQEDTSSTPEAESAAIDMFDIDGVLHDAIQWSGQDLTVERLRAEEPRLPALALNLAHCRAHVSDYLFPPLLLRFEHVVRIASRIRIRAELAAHPEVLTRPIEQPLVVTGLFRTGTTLLYNLLAVQDNARAPRLWELQDPAPAPHPDTMATDPRIEQQQALGDRELKDVAERGLHNNYEPFRNTWPCGFMQ